MDDNESSSSNEEDDEKRSNSQGENEQTWMDNPGETQRNNGEDDTAECKDSQQTVLQWCRDNSYGHLETSAKGELDSMNTIFFFYHQLFLTSFADVTMEWMFAFYFLCIPIHHYYYR